MERQGTRCRIYAPVGAHRDLLAYLVRRLLENGANSSFVNQIVDEDVPPEIVAADPFDMVGTSARRCPTGPRALPARTRELARASICAHRRRWTRSRGARAPFADAINGSRAPAGGRGRSAEERRPVINPADPATARHRRPGPRPSMSTRRSAAADAMGRHRRRARRKSCNRIADLYEANYGEIFAILAREAGKSHARCRGRAARGGGFPALLRRAHAPDDAAGRHLHLHLALELPAGHLHRPDRRRRWPRATRVLAKPAEQTPLIAISRGRADARGRRAATALQLLPGARRRGRGADLGSRAWAAWPSPARTATARLIRRAMAENLAPGAPLIAETGGLNAMIVDSTALPEQAVRADHRKRLPVRRPALLGPALPLRAGGHRRELPPRC